MALASQFTGASIKNCGTQTQRFHLKELMVHESLRIFMLSPKKEAVTQLSQQVNSVLINFIPFSYGWVQHILHTDNRNSQTNLNSKGSSTSVHLYFTTL